MSVAAPPDRPRRDGPDLLVREARARQRRRRLRVAALVAGVAAAALAGYAVAAGGRSTGRGASGAPAGAAARRCPAGDLGTVAFVRGGALRLLDLHGCRTRTLVPAGAAAPVRISPDGRWVAFTGGFVSARGGGVHRTVGVGTWSPRGDVLAVGTRRGGLQLVRPDGRVRRLLPDGWGVHDTAFSPDGRTLAVSRSLFGLATIHRPSAWHQEIWLLDVATGTRRELFHLRPGELAPALLQGFSPDGRWLLFWEDLQSSASLLADGVPLVALPVSGGRPRVVAKGELHERDFLTWCGGSLTFVLNHGGRLVTQGDGIALASPPAWRTRVLLPTGGHTSWNAVSCPAGANGPLVVSAGPSSSSNLNLRPGSEHRALWLVSPTQGSSPQRLPQAAPPAGASDELPQWSRDGRWLLFVRTAPHGAGALYAIDPYGGNLVGPVAPIGRSDPYYGDYGWENVLDWHR